LIEQGLTSPPTQYRLYGRRFFTGRKFACDYYYMSQRPPGLAHSLPVYSLLNYWKLWVWHCVIRKRAFHFILCQSGLSRHL